MRLPLMAPLCMRAWGLLIDASLKLYNRCNEYDIYT